MTDSTSPRPVSRAGRKPATAARRRRARANARIREDAAPGARLPRRLAPRKSPTQERARATVEAILEAAVDLFSSRGYARTSTNHIARRAGVSVGSLYQYFPNKDAVLTELLARHLAAVESAISGCLPLIRDPAVPLRDGMRRLLERLREVHDSDPRLSRAIEQQAGQMPVVPEGLAIYRRGHVASVTEILSTRPDVRPGNHALMAVVLSEIAEAVSGILVHGTPGRFGRDELLDEAVEAICRYVEGTCRSSRNPSGPSSSGTRSTPVHGEAPKTK